MLIVFEGIDGSGKSTQAKMLHDALDASGANCQLTKCPDYAGTFMGPKIKRYLEGGFGDLDTNHPFLVSMLYALDRFENRNLLRTLLCADVQVVCDRYTYSNIAHQCAKIYDSWSDDPIWKATAFDILKLELEVLGLPNPDKTVYLDISAEHSFARTHANWVPGDVKDIHEDDREYMAKVRKVYQWFALRTSTWVTIPCFELDRPRSEAEIHREICNKLGITPLQ